MHVTEKGLGFIKAHFLNGVGSLIPECSRFFNGCSDFGCLGALRLVSPSRPSAFWASGRGYLAFFSHVTQLSAIETGGWFLVAIRGSGSSFALREGIYFHFGFFIRGGI